MSYCRWSSDDFMCDLYCYADIGGGWTTHVARRRSLRRPETPSPYTREALEKAQIADLPLEPIGLPYDGMTFNDATLESFRERVVMLLAAGYAAPDHLIERIDAEIAEAKDTPTP